MKDLPNHPSSAMSPSEAESGINTRILRTMAAAVAVSGVVSALFAPWRVTTGLLLGGILSLLSHHWLSSSISAAFSLVLPGAKPRIKLVRYVLRYFVVSLVVYAAYKLRIVSLLATILGLCGFVVALFVEASREFYFTIVQREEIP